jgi:hypothetical protein
LHLLLISPTIARNCLFDRQRLIFGNADSRLRKGKQSNTPRLPYGQGGIDVLTKKELFDGSGFRFVDGQ